MNGHQAVHKRENSKLSGGMDKAGSDGGVSIELLCISDSQQLIAPGCGFMKALTLLESWFTIYPLIAPKIVDAIILILVKC